MKVGNELEQLFVLPQERGLAQGHPSSAAVSDCHIGNIVPNPFHRPSPCIEHRHEMPSLLAAEFISVVRWVAAMESKDCMECRIVGTLSFSGAGIQVIKAMFSILTSIVRRLSALSRQSVAQDDAAITPPHHGDGSRRLRQHVIWCRFIALLAFLGLAVVRATL